MLTGQRIERKGELDHLNDDELERAVIERLTALGFISGTDTQH